MLELVEQEIEGRTPVSRQYQGLQGDEINKTATSAHIVNNRATARVELICRTFAETGIKDLFRGILWLLGKYQQEPLTVRVHGNYTPIDPRAWQTEYDMTINVGLGTGSKQEQLAMLQGIEQSQMMSLQAFGPGLIVTPNNIYNLNSKKAQLAGFKDPNQFFSPPPPNWHPPQPPPPPQIAVEQMRQQGEQAKLQQEAGLEQQRMQMEDQIKQRELASSQAVQTSNDMRDAARTQAELQLKDQMHQREMAMQDVQHQREQETAIRIAWINAQAKTEAAAISGAKDPKDGGVEAQEASGAGA